MVSEHPTSNQQCQSTEGTVFVYWKFYKFVTVCVCVCCSISESLVALNHKKSTATSRHTGVCDGPVSNGREVPAQSTPGDVRRPVGKESILKPLNMSSSNLDSSVQTIIEKMHSGLEVRTCYNAMRLQGRGRYGVVCRGNPIWSIPEGFEVKFQERHYTSTLYLYLYMLIFLVGVFIHSFFNLFPFLYIYVETHPDPLTDYFLRYLALLLSVFIFSSVLFSFFFHLQVGQKPIINLTNYSKSVWTAWISAAVLQSAELVHTYTHTYVQNHSILYSHISK